MKIALITGASSGLGREYVRVLDRSERYDELWLVARREDRLRETAAKLSHRSRILVCDLSEKQSAEMIGNALLAACADGSSVALFVNCAGAGCIGNWQSISSADNDMMIDLNCRAAVELTTVVIPFMKRGGRIIEIASTAAFQPFQQFAVYSATKAFLVSYLRALRWELFPRGVCVTAVCPYWMRKTEFIGRAKERGQPAAIRNYLFGDIPHIVVWLSLWGSAVNLPVVTPGIVCTVHRIAAKFIPHEIMQGAWEGWRRI